MPRLQIVGQLLVCPEDWEVVNDCQSPDAVFVAYNRLPPDPMPTCVKVIGTNMSRPLWDAPNLVTTRDIPRDILDTVTPTAEHAIGLMMALHRNIIPASREPLADRSEFLAPKMLSRMTAGILGFGRIGKMIWRRTAYLFNATGVYDPVAFPNGSLEEVLRKSEVLFFCCPYSPFGHPMGLAEFKQMPPDALIINIAQPDLLNWVDALSALETGGLRGVAADVFPEWVVTYAEDFPEKMLLTPHIAGSTMDARRITEKAVLDVMRSKL